MKTLEPFHSGIFEASIAWGQNSWLVANGTSLLHLWDSPLFQVLKRKKKRREKNQLGHHYSLFADVKNKRKVKWNETPKTAELWGLISLTLNIWLLGRTKLSICFSGLRILQWHKHKSVWALYSRHQTGGPGYLLLQVKISNCETVKQEMIKILSNKMSQIVILFLLLNISYF